MHNPKSKKNVYSTRTAQVASFAMNKHSAPSHSSAASTSTASEVASAWTSRQTCRLDADCEEDGFVCEPDGRCRAGAGPEAECVDDAGCPGRQFCDGAVCVEPDICVADIDCREGRHCDGGLCRFNCRDDSNCQAPRLCGRADASVRHRWVNVRRMRNAPADNRGGDAVVRNRPSVWPILIAAESACVSRARPAPCLGDADCPGENVCEAGHCAPPVDHECVRDIQCPGAQTCGGNPRRCIEPGLCQADQDCIGAESAMQASVETLV